jgi:uroporphyrinogen-III synthase
MQVIVTRPQADSRALVEKLEARGHRAIVSPLLTIKPREDAAIPSLAHQAIALTSANALLHTALAPAPEALKRVKVLAVGAQSAAAARRAGYQTVQGEGGDVAGLADTIARACAPRDGPILYPSGAETAGDLKGTLEKKGFTVTRVVLYDAVPAESLTPETIAALKQGSADGVLLYSPRSARLWTMLATRAGLGDATRALRHFCLSPNVAAALGFGFVTEVAARPDEPSLLALLDRNV